MNDFIRLFPIKYSLNDEYIKVLNIYKMNKTISYGTYSFQDSSQMNGEYTRNHSGNTTGFRPKYPLNNGQITLYI